jgi:hypothetical protein
MIADEHPIGAGRHADPHLAVGLLDLREVPLEPTDHAQMVGGVEQPGLAAADRVLDLLDPLVVHRPRREQHARQLGQRLADLRSPRDASHGALPAPDHRDRRVRDDLRLEGVRALHVDVVREVVVAGDHPRSGPPYLFLSQRLAQMNASRPPSWSSCRPRSKNGTYRSARS